MARNIEMSTSEFAQVLACFGDPCSTAIPGGDPEAIPPDPESCQHWIELVYVLKAADLAIAQNANQGGGGRAMVTIVDDFCGTPSPLAPPLAEAETVQTRGPLRRSAARRRRPLPGGCRLARL
ncbi:MAG TPA: hypothetical protein VI039_07825 [Solirubrobacterales bacterium]